MTPLLAFLLLCSLIGNGILIWYTRRLVQNLYYGVNNIDEMQKMLNEYADLLAPVANMENYYGDPAITATIANTKLVIDACRVYKKTLIQDYDEENSQNQEDQEGQGEEDYQEVTQKTGQENRQEAGKEKPRKAEATIGPISPNLS